MATSSRTGFRQVRRNPAPKSTAKTRTDTPRLRRVFGSLFRKDAPAGQAIAAVPRRSSDAEPAADVRGAETPSSAIETSAIIEHAAKRVSETVAAATAARVDSLASQFVLPKASATADLHVFVFHVDMGAAGKLQYRDVTMDVGRFDYVAILQTFKQCVFRVHPQAVVFLVTSPGSPLTALRDERTRVVELDIPHDQPMYQRVVSMCAYVHSAAFTRDTLFLDSDAFLNASFKEYLDADYDVAVTVRDDAGLMPVNEGVIVARAERPEAVRGFFDRYLATYEALLSDDRITGYYGDIRKWRGGQLSLNAATRNAHPYSSQRRISIGETRLQCLPCDPFNYSYEYGANVAQERLATKIIVHLKGGRKSDLKAALASIEANGVSNYIEPYFTTWNKEYKEPPFGDKAVISSFVGAVRSAANISQANSPSGDAILVDDMFVWFRAVHFLRDPSFVEAMGPLRDDLVLRARIWRVYTLCWAAKSCMSLDGDYVDIGCYDGKTVAVIDRYCRFSQQSAKKYWMFDIFDNPPLESRKVGHGPDLYEHVRTTFSDESRYAVVKGPVPYSFDGNLPQKIAFAQIDLNAAEPELAALERIFNRIVPGGMIVFDDFGFSRYSQTRELEADFVARHGLSIFECPTGQGIFIKR
jgi:O-methyltransferase